MRSGNREVWHASPAGILPVKDILLHRILTITLFAVYLIPRIIQYFFNRSFWWDEAALAVNVMDRSYIGLMQTLDFKQAAPIGFLFISKLSGDLFGYNEYALRFFPLVCSIVAVYLFYLICRILLDPLSGLIAMVFFSISVPLIRYASEFKQYTTDMVSTLLIFLIGIILNMRIKTGVNSKLLLITFFLIGIILPLFSHPAVLVLSIIGIWLLINMIIQNNWKTVTALLCFYAVWLIAFYCSYIFLLEKNINDDYLIRFYRSSSHYWGSPDLGAFLPIPISKTTAILSLKWTKKTFMEMFAMPGGFYFNEIAACFFIVGCIVFFDKEKNTFYAMISILMLTVFISALELYPFYQRFIIFLIPFIYIITAKSVCCVAEKVVDRPGNKKILLIVLVCMLSAQGYRAGKLFVNKDETMVEIRPALEYIILQKKSNDLIYVPFALRPVIQYYSYIYELDKEIIRISEGSVFDENISDKHSLYEKDLLTQFKSSDTVWVILTYIPDYQKAMYLEILSKIGKGALVYEYRNVCIYKYVL